MLSAAGGTTAGSTLLVTVTAVDAYGRAINYTGPVRFGSSDPQAGLPATYTLTAADHGSHTFAITLKTAGNQSVVATAGPVSGQVSVQVAPAAAARFTLTAPSVTKASAATPVTLTALDAYGNLATSYRGNIWFASSDRQAILPGSYAFTAADAGKHTFSITFRTRGLTTLTVSDPLCKLTGTVQLSVSTGLPVPVGP
jgi:hypothetical protein